MSYRGTWYGLQGQDAVEFGRSMVVGGLCVPIAAFLGLFSEVFALPVVLVSIGAFARAAYIAKTRIGPIRRY